MSFPGVNTTFLHTNDLKEQTLKLLELSKTDKDYVIPVIIMCMTTFEAQFNEFVDRLDSRFETETSKETKVAIKYILERYEEDKLSLKTKIIHTFFLLTNKRIDISKPPYQDLFELIDIRNYIIHSKSEKFIYKEFGKPERIKNKYDKMLLFLESRKLLTFKGYNRYGSWFSFIQKYNLAEWAYRICNDAINNLYEL